MLFKFSIEYTLISPHTKDEYEVHVEKSTFTTIVQVPTATAVIGAWVSITHHAPPTNV